MKNIFSLVILLISCLLSSCAFQNEQGQYYGGFGYNKAAGQRQGGNGAQQQRPWGQKTSYRQLFLTKETRGATIRIQGDAPSLVCVQVKEQVGAWCQKTHSTHGVYPTRAEATQHAKQCFANLGYNLHPTDSVGSPGGFKITEYIQTEVIGQRVKHGEPEFLGTRQISEREVPQSILQRSRQGKFDAPRRAGDYGDHLNRPVPYGQGRGGQNTQYSTQHAPPQGEEIQYYRPGDGNIIRI